MDQKRIYIVRFESKMTVEKFIKIGVSANKIEERFVNDLRNYDITLLEETGYYESCDSFIVESNFHNLLSMFKYEPKLRLTSGNTECFVDSMECLRKINDILYRKFPRTYSTISPFRQRNNPGYKEYIKEMRARRYGKEYIKPILKMPAFEIYDDIFTDKFLKDMELAIEENKKWEKKRKERLSNIAKAEKIRKKQKRRATRKQQREEKLKNLTNLIIPPVANIQKWHQSFCKERYRLKRIEIEASNVFNGFYFLDETRNEVSISKKYRKKFMMISKPKVKAMSPLLSGKGYTKSKY